MGWKTCAHRDIARRGGGRCIRAQRRPCARSAVTSLSRRLRVQVNRIGDALRPPITSGLSPHFVGSAPDPQGSFERLRNGEPSRLTSERHMQYSLPQPFCPFSLTEASRGWFCTTAGLSSETAFLLHLSSTSATLRSTPACALGASESVLLFRARGGDGICCRLWGYLRHAVSPSLRRDS